MDELAAASAGRRLPDNGEGDLERVCRGVLIDQLGCDEGGDGGDEARIQEHHSLALLAGLGSESSSLCTWGVTAVDEQAAVCQYPTLGGETRVGNGADD